MTERQKGYGFPQPTQQVFPEPFITTRDPTTADGIDKGFVLGQQWVNRSNNTVYVFTSESAGSATWSLSTAGSSQVDTLTGDAGGAISPVAGNITLAGGTNLTTTGAAGSITFDLDSTITLATSLETPHITAGAGNDLIIEMGDAAGANKVSFQDSAAAEVASINSDGDLSCFDFTSTGPNSTISNTNTASTVLIAGGTGGNTISIGGGANTGVQSITIGNGNAAANMTVSIMGGTPSAGTQTLNLGTGSGVAKTVQIANGTLGNTVGIATGINSVAQTVNISTGASGANSTVAILTGNGTAGTQTLNVLTGTRAGALNLATGAAAHVIAVGSASAGAVTVDTAAGISLDAATVSNFTVTGAGADLNLLAVGGSVLVDSTEDAALAIRLHANGGTSETIQLHSDQGTGVGSVNLLSDVGGLTLRATGLASADAINLEAAAGGIDVDAALQINIASSQNAGDAIVINASAGAIDITAAGAAGEDIDISNTAGSVNITGGEAAVANAVRINASAADGGMDVDAGTGGITIDTTGAFSIDGATASNVTVTGAGADLTLNAAGGSVLVSSTEDAALAIRLHANGGTSETIQLHSDQGTGVGSINLLSDVGGITFTATGLASADAINLEATAGGIDMDSALLTSITSTRDNAQAILLQATAGGIDILASGASAGEDIDITATGSSINLTSTEAVGDAIVINASDAAGGVDISAGTGNITLAGSVLKTTNPCFLGHLGASALNKTGNGASYTLGTDALTEDFDRGGNFTTAGVFTAPVTGIYDLRAQVTVTGNTIATTFVIAIVTTLRTYQYTFTKVAGSQDETVAISTLADMTATNTATVTITVSGEAADTSDIKGAGTLETYFCGRLVA